MKSQPFIVPLLGLICGILLADFSPNGILPFTVFSLLFLVFLLLFYFQRNTISYSFIIFLFFAGFSLFHTKQYNEYTPLNESLIGKEVLIKLKIEETYRSSEKYKKYKAKILQIDSFPSTKTNVLLYLKKENNDVYTNDELWILSKIYPTQKSLNPHQFDYSDYLKRQKIYYTLFSDSILLKEKSGQGFLYFCSQLKKSIHNKLVKAGYDKQSVDQIGAMLLGDRTEMDKEVEDSYRKTGVVHILSISGLHIVMVYSIFYFLLYPLVFIKNGKSIRIFTALTLIWTYVLLVGFYPPVLRSALMIAVFHITVAIHRKPNIYHTLAVSAFILLIFNPNFLFNPGFQLSFSAVFFIVFFHKSFQIYTRSKSKILTSLYNFTGTCISAQAGTLPFSIFYFNQTSGLFLLGNIVMISASYIMIAGGIVSIFLVLVNWDFPLWVQFFNLFMEICNSYIAWLSSFDFLVFDSLHLRLFEAALLLLGLILLRYILIHPKFKLLISFLCLIFLFQFSRFYHTQKLSQKNELIIFHHYKNTIIGLRKGPFLSVYMKNLKDSTAFNQYTLKSYVIHENIKKLETRNLNDLCFSQDLNATYVLIQDNANPTNSVYDSSTLFILDGSNYSTHHFKFKNFSIWNTQTDGALILDLSKNGKSHP